MNNELKLMWYYIKNYKIRIIFYIILTLIKYVGIIIIPICFGAAIEALTNNTINTFVTLIITYFGMKVLNHTIIDYICVMIYNSLEKDFVKNVTKDMYKKIENLPTSAFETKGTGEITNRLTSDPEKVMSMFSQIIRLISSFISFIFAFIIIFYMSFLLAIEVFIFFVIMLIVVYVVFPKFENMEKENRKNSDDFNKIITENIVGIREIKALGIKNILNRNVGQKVDKLTNSTNKINNYMTLYWNLNNLLFYIFEIVIFITAAHLVADEQLSLALFLTLQSYMWRVDAIVYDFGNFSKNYSKVKVALNRIDEIINNRLYNDEVYGDINLSDNKGLVTFKNVKFKYEGETDFTLDGLNLKCLPNQKTAIIGRSGNGKSTLFNLLVRYFDTTEGSIFIDNTDIRDLTEESLRKNVSIIRQNPHIFNMSIKDNLKIVNEDISDDEIISACKKAYIHDYILSLNDGYDTIIGEGGINLSGGQKQRLAIARTLLIKSKIILFDEATSALDNESQEYIKKTIDNLICDHTIIIIAHRLSTIIDADVINIIHKGKVVESGTHKELIESSNIYKKLYYNEE